MNKVLSLWNETSPTDYRLVHLPYFLYQQIAVSMLHIHDGTRKLQQFFFLFGPDTYSTVLTINQSINLSIRKHLYSAKINKNWQCLCNNMLHLFSKPTYMYCNNKAKLCALTSDGRIQLIWYLLSTVQYYAHQLAHSITRIGTQENIYWIMKNLMGAFTFKRGLPFIFTWAVSMQYIACWYVVDLNFCLPFVYYNTSFKDSAIWLVRAHYIICFVFTRNLANAMRYTRSNLLYP